MAARRTSPVTPLMQRVVESWANALKAPVAAMINRAMRVIFIGSFPGMRPRVGDISPRGGAGRRQDLSGDGQIVFERRAADIIPLPQRIPDSSVGRATDC